MKKIFWVASYPKSGNTWMRAILCSLFFSKDGRFDFYLFNNIVNFDNHDKYKFVKEINIDDYNKLHELSVICKYWLEAQRRTNVDGNFAFFKTHSGNITLDKHQYTNEDNSSGLIYLVRDPRDVVISYAKHNRITIDKSLENLTSRNSITWNGIPKKKSYPILLSSWDINYKTWKTLNVPKIIVKYEDMLNNTKDAINVIINFFKQNYGFQFPNKDQLISNIMETTSFDALKKHEKKYGFNEARYYYIQGEIEDYFFRKGVVGQWKNELTKTQKSKIENLFKETMVELGYL